MDHQAAPWWQGQGLDRVLADLLSAEVARLRPGSPAAAPDRTPGTPLGEGGLRLDSLERVRVATALEEAFSLPPGPAADPLLAAPTFGALVAATRALLPGAEPALTFRTSGSTGRPKPVRHELATLLREVEHLATLVGPAPRVLSAVPAHPIYGFLFTVLLPWRLGAEVLDLRRARPGSLPALARPGDLLVATPALWADLAGRAGWPPGVTGVTSGAPCPPATSAGLRAAGLRLLEIYGSTETGGIGWRDDEAEPFRLLPAWRRGPEGSLVRTGDVRGGAIDLPDHVEWTGPDRLRPLRRRDGAVQVAGANVWPERVREVLLAHPAVREARVRLMRPDEGDWLKAFVVPRDASTDPDGLRRDLDGWARARLSPPERPRAISVGPALPVTPSGKPGDWFLDG